MKKIFILASLVTGATLFASCESDRDSNPIYQTPTEFTLNVPAYVNGIYDLEHSKTVELTCTQPNYGFTAATTYTVQVALDENFETLESLATSFSTAKMDVISSELAVAATNLKVQAGVTEEEFPIETALYVRLKAQLNESQGVTYSNSVKLTKVRVYFALPPVTLPTKMYVTGDFCEWDWNKAPEMIPFHDGTTGAFWRMVYIPQGSAIKFNQSASADGKEFGATATLKDNNNAQLSGTDKIEVANGGWYLLVVRSAIDGRNTNYTVEFNEPAVYIYGEANGGTWEPNAAWKFTVPTTADDFFVSPAFAANAPDGIRVTVVVEGYDWWKSEFMVFDGKIEYRADGGDQDRIAGTAGQRVYLNFTSDTGKIE